MVRRNGLSPKKRFDVLKRDGFKCQYCGNDGNSVSLEVDHIVAVANGGSDDEGNLITACFNCNRGKGARQVVSGGEDKKRVVVKDVPLNLYYGKPGEVYFAALVCPICKGDYVHFMPMQVEQRKTTTVVDELMTSVFSVDGPREHSVVMEFYCENGHSFDYRLESWKGHIRLWATNQPEGGR